MPVDCQRSTSGGKGNLGMFIERTKNVCAAGLPTAQPDEKVADHLQHYLLKDEVDALLSDAILPPKKPRPLPPLRHPIPLDQRYAGIYGQVAGLVNPPLKTKFQIIADDLKETPYTSYWTKPLGKSKDPVPMLPEGFDIEGTTFGKKTPFHGRLYDIVTPKVPYPDRTPYNKKAGVQIKRIYCSPPFDPDLTFGHRTFVDKRGTYARCCVTDDRIVTGTANYAVVNSIQANFLDETQPRTGSVLAPNDNIKNVPEGYSFGRLKPPGNLPDCLTYCKRNPEQDMFRKCISHLNSLRKCLSTRYLPSFFYTLYRNLKYFDKEKSGWLQKKIIYDFCGTKFVRFNPALIEPLLSLWSAFDGSRIEYKTFTHILNFKQPLPDLPKIRDLPADCLDFRTTYGEMVKPDQIADNGPMAGIPSGRYFDLDYPNTPERYTKADKVCLPHESDMKSCLCPSVLTLLHVTHRDMYAKREPHVVRRVFEASGEKFTDETFNSVWEEAKKFHTQGWVCFESFRKALIRSQCSEADGN